MADDERGAEGEVGDLGAHALHELALAVGPVAAAHELEHAVAGVLQRHVDVGQHLGMVREELDELFGELLGIEVEQAQPVEALAPRPGRCTRCERLRPSSLRSRP